MLQLIGYDLQSPTKNYPALCQGIEDAGGGINLLNGPWICGADPSPKTVLKTLQRALAKQGSTDDKLLVIPVRMGEIGTGRNLDQENPHPGRRKKVFAVAYTLRNPAEAEKRRQALRKAIEALDSKAVRPLNALWFLKADSSAHKVRLALEKSVPLTPKDELMVVEISAETKGTGTRNVGKHGWLTKDVVQLQ